MLQILWEHLLSSGIFPDFIHLYNKGEKKNKFKKILTKINSTESYIRDMVLKFLLEPIPELSILQKSFQDLYQQDKLVMQLT